MSYTRALVDKLLTGVSQAYMPTGFIADQVLPTLKSTSQSGKVTKFGNQHLRVVNSIMGGRAGARRIDTRQFASDQFYVEPHGLEDVIAPEEYGNVQGVFDIEQVVTMQLTTALQMGKEVMLANTLRSTSNLTQNQTLSGTSQFNDYVNSNPVAIFAAAKNAIRAGSGAMADTAIMDYQVADTLRYHPSFVRALGYADNRAGQLTNDELAKVMNVRRVLIADVFYNSSSEGQADALTSVWGKDIIFCAAPNDPAQLQKTLGYWVGLTGEAPRAVYKQPVVNPPNATSIIVKDNYDLILTDLTCGYLIKNAIA